MARARFSARSMLPRAVRSRTVARLRLGSGLPRSSADLSSGRAAARAVESSLARGSHAASTGGQSGGKGKSKG